MDPQTALKRVARIEYAVIRIPLDILDGRVVRQYLDETSPVRQTFERALRTLDDVVGQWLQDPLEPPEEPFVAPTVAPTTRTAPPAPAPKPAPAEDEAERVEALADELIAEQETEVFAGELAENDELRQIQAELKAKHLVEEQDE